jgi:hypothetical protein
MTDLPQRIAKVFALDAKRTQGKWEASWVCTTDCDYSLMSGWRTIAEKKNEKGDGYASDFLFIASAPEMVAIIREQLEQMKAIRETLKYYAYDDNYAYDLPILEIRGDMAKEALSQTAYLEDL